MLNLDYGSLERIEGRDVFVTKVGSPGCAVFGPYTDLPAGRYVVECRVWADPAAPQSDNVAGWADVAIEGGARIIAKTHLFPHRQRSDGRLYMPFHLDAAASVEARVHTLGRVPLQIDLTRLFRELGQDELNFSPILEPETAVADRFFLSHLAEFSGLYEAGATVIPTANGTRIEVEGMSFLAVDVEAFQIAREVFFSNDYTLRSARPKIAIDVGMNIGLASLRLANDPLVKAVYAFEPFAVPFRRAVENFRLNPAIAAKISPFAFGLSDADQSFDVLVDEEQTIATSVRGRQSGKTERIQVRDAAAVLAPIFRDALDRGADIVMKIDCEGSEFPIFETLAKAGLLKDVKAFMMEWHKWWSPDQSRSALFAPLLAAGYTIFDRTDPADLWAGQIYAVR